MLLTDVHDEPSYSSVAFVVGGVPPQTAPAVCVPNPPAPNLVVFKVPGTAVQDEPL
jgi:hypothetical protein